MKKKSGFTLIELLVVIAIITILAALLVPCIAAARRAAKRGSSKALLGTVSVALQEYSTDFSGYYPPADAQSAAANFYGQGIDNSPNSLCIYLTANNISDDGRPSGGYLPFQRRNLLFGGATTFSKTPSGLPAGITIKGVNDYVVDAFFTPVIYDERKSENDSDGLNFESFVLISGGAWNRIPTIGFGDVDAGAAGMFSSRQNCRPDMIDTSRNDYGNGIPNFSITTNDDLFNM